MNYCDDDCIGRLSVDLFNRSTLRPKQSGSFTKKNKIEKKKQDPNKALNQTSLIDVIGIVENI